MVDPDDTYMLDNVVRFVGQRVAAVAAETEAAAEAACRLLEVEYELLPAVFDPELAMEPGAPILHDKSVAFRDNVYVDIHGELGNVEQGFKEADAIHEMTYSTSRAQHVHLETHGSHRLAGRRRPAACADQLAGAVHRQAEALLSARTLRPRRACLHRTGRRRLRRQAGDDLRGFMRARRAEDRSAGDVGVHPGGAIHRRHHAPSDDHACEAWRQAGRHADRDAGPRRVQHRRLWQPWRRDAGRFAVEPDRGLSLPQQEGRRLRGLHQHGPGRRLPRLRRHADHLRHRMRHRRPRQAAGDEPVRDQAHQQGAGDRPNRVRSGRTRPTSSSAATASINVSISSSRRSRAAGG